QQRHCRIGHYVQKIVHSHKSGKHGPAMTKLHNNARGIVERFQLQRGPLRAMCLAKGEVVAARIADHIEPHHNDPIKVWNGKLQSMCALTGGITRTGDEMVRTALYEAANVLLSRITRFSKLKRWGMDVAKRRGSKRAKVALARKIAVILHRMWIDGTTY